MWSESECLLKLVVGTAVRLSERRMFTPEAYLLWSEKLAFIFGDKALLYSH